MMLEERILHSDPRYLLIADTMLEALLGSLCFIDDYIVRVFSQIFEQSDSPLFFLVR